MQALQQVFMTEVMPLIMKGFGTGFDCKWTQEIIEVGEAKLAELLAQYGFEFLTQAVTTVVDMILTFFNIKKDCDAELISENALF